MIEQLKELGFGEKEIAVYLAVLEYGKALPAVIAKKTRINRSTVYAVAEELISKGLIAEDLAGKSAYLVALPPERLLSIIEKEEMETKRRKDLAKEAVEQLGKITGAIQYAVPKIRFIPEGDLDNFLRTQLTVWQESSKNTDGICWGFQDHSFAETFEVWVDWAATKHPMDIRLLTNISPIERKMEKKNYDRRAMRVWSSGQDFTSSFWVLGSYIVMIATREKPHYLVEIHDSTMAHNLCQLFKGLWESLDK